MSVQQPQTVKRSKQPPFAEDEMYFQSFGDCFKVVEEKKAKVREVRALQKSKSDLYFKLAGKLELELKGIKNHNTPEAREKLFLLQKCKNEKHIRNKSKQQDEGFQSRYYVSAKPSFYRPSTGCSRKTKSGSLSTWGTMSRSRKENSASTSALATKRLQEIQNECLQETKKSELIRNELGTATFYQKMVRRNFSMIFTRML